MPTNRFYTPALPQYTSQFVEDKTPWDQLIDLEQQKIARSDAALQGLSEAQSAFTSLTPGYRTQELVPGVVSEYENQLRQWQKKHAGATYTVPAMQELTAIQGRFQADPRVKMVQQDYAMNEYYDRLRANESYRPETDPNINPETGKLRQFTDPNQFREYQQPVWYGDLGEELRDRMSKVTPRAFTEQGTAYVPGPDGKPVAVRRTIDRTERSAQDYDDEREAIIESVFRGDTPGARYAKAIYGDQWSRDKARELVMEQEKDMYLDQSQARESFFPEYTSDQGGGPGPGVKTPVTAQVVVPPNNIGGTASEGGADISSYNEMWLNLRQRKVDPDKGLFKGAKETNMEYYNAVKNNPQAILNKKITLPNGEIKDASAIIGLSTSDIIKLSMAEAPYSTMSMWEDYWKKAERENIPGWQDDKKKIDKYINSAKEMYQVGSPKFENDIEYNKAINAARETNSDILANITADTKEMDINTSLALREALEERQKEVQESAYRGEMIAFEEDWQNYWSVIFGGIGLNNDQTINKTGSPPEQFMGSVIIDPNDPNKFIDDDTKEKWWREDNPMAITGMYTNETSQYGSGAFTLSTPDGNYIIKNPNDADEYDYVINSASRMQNNNEGDFFAVKGLTQTNEGLVPEVVTRWNKQQKSVTDSDTWMNVALDHIESLGDTSGEGPRYVVRVYQGDPNGDNDALLNRYDPDKNKKGYINVALTDANGNYFTKTNPPDADQVQQTIVFLHYYMNVKKGMLGANDAAKGLSDILGYPQDTTKDWIDNFSLFE